MKDSDIRPQGEAHEGSQRLREQGRAVPRVPNDQFTRSLFACILVRVVDPASYANVLTGLANGSLTQPGLVQFVLGSPEFTSGVLPRLRRCAERAGPRDSVTRPG